jgi:hypothetical protein
MNFSDFLAQKITDDSQTHKIKKTSTIKSSTIKSSTIKSSTIKSSTIKSSTIKSETVTQTPPNQTLIPTETHEHKQTTQNAHVHQTSHTHGYFRPIFRKGDFIKIVRMENSIHNVYKGYYGEILEYDKNSDYALVILDAKHSHAPIKCHINHLQKRHN